MGVDVYLHWEGQTEEERQRQFCGFDVTKGAEGYLRESYGAAAGLGRPVSVLLGGHDWDEPIEVTPQVIAGLETKLPAAKEEARARYVGADWVGEAVESLEAFVSLAKRKLAESSRVWISISG